MNNMLKEYSEDAVYVAHMKEVILEDFKPRVADNLNGDVFLPISNLISSY